MNIVLLPTSYPNIYNQNSSIFVQDQAESLAKNGVDVSIVGAIPISFKYIFNKKIFKFGNFKTEKDGVKSHLFLYPTIPKLRKFNQYLRDKINRYLLKKYLVSNKIDLLHVHNAAAGESAQWMKRKYNIPYVVTEHSSAFARNTISKKEILNYFDIYNKSSKNIAVSQEFAYLLSSIYDLDFQYIPNIVDTAYFKLDNKSKNKEFNFINIANLNKNKNQMMLINAFYKSFKDNRNVKLTILGSGPEYRNLQKEIDRLKMNEQIKLFGFATREQVLKELQTSDTFVLSSKYETFGVVIIEAMSCGIPVVSTKCGGPESIIENESLGVLVENNDVQLLSEAMLKIQTIKYNHNYIREYTIDNYSQKIIARQLKKIYENIINEH
ncbi:MAG: hypothetical protein DRG78_07930 [Epsilonproteobacteria bacterium]|nr:MAG: hypothetical protein DRG78_07930 [Campylobacterota bacterium]